MVSFHSEVPTISLRPRRARVGAGGEGEVGSFGQAEADRDRGAEHLADQRQLGRRGRLGGQQDGAHAKVEFTRGQQFRQRQRAARIGVDEIRAEAVQRRDDGRAVRRLQVIGRQHHPVTQAPGGRSIEWAHGVAAEAQVTRAVDAESEPAPGVRIEGFFDIALALGAPDADAGAGRAAAGRVAQVARIEALVEEVALVRHHVGLFDVGEACDQFIQRRVADRRRIEAHALTIKGDVGNCHRQDAAQALIRRAGAPVCARLQ
jgi:hypothetical protein